MQFNLWGLLLFILGSPICGTTLAAGIDTTINKDNNNHWTVAYSTSQPVKRIAFVRNPDASRVQRWTIADQDLEIVLDDGKEYIVSKTKPLFQTATLSLTPSYKHLPKDYAPFSPFSDGSTLIHSGRLFACENSCDDQLNEWKITLNAPKDDYIIVDGKSHRANISWLDSANGQNIYVGHQKPLVTDSFITVIDAGLPGQIKTSLQTDIPKMMSYLESNLRKLPVGQKPSLFASYAKVDGTSVQAGVLPNQIFIHWNRNNLEKQVGNQRFINDLLWTFAHEAGHFYQQFADLSLADNDSWIHEGHAEMLAFDTIKYLYPKSEQFLAAKENEFKRLCAAGLSQTTLNDAAQVGMFPLYYSCGFLIQQAIENARNTKNHQHSAYALWNSYLDKRNKDNKTARMSFLDAITELTNKKLAEKINRFVSLRHAEPMKEIEVLLRLE
jgi:hypothetical protein